VQPAALRVIERHAAAVAAGEPPQRLAGAAAAQVPQGRVDRGERERRDGADRGRARGCELVRPERLHFAGVAPDQAAQQVLAQHREDRSAARADRVRVAEAGVAVVGRKLDEDRLLLEEGLHRVRAEGLDLEIDEEALGTDDLRHGASQPQARTLVANCFWSSFVFVWRA
jgi:hypothetical protein